MLWDRKAALSRVGDEVEFFREVLQAYKAGAEEMLRAMGQALEQGDDEGWRNAAHGLKGASLNVGAVRLGQRLADMEHCGLPDGKEAGEQMERLRALYGETLQAIRRGLEQEADASLSDRD